MIASAPLEIQIWPIDRLVLYARNPRKNDAVVDRMCSSIREYGFKIPVLARSADEVVDGHLRLKAARKLGSWPGGDIIWGCPCWRAPLIYVRADTVVRWQRERFRRFWAQRSRVNQRHRGRPATAVEIRRRIERMVAANLSGAHPGFTAS
jgi:hypothetical protein